MGSIVLKDIHMTLDPTSIKKAIDEIRLFESRLKPAMQSLLEYLGEKGVEIARAELIFFDEPAYYTGALSRSIQYASDDGKVVIQAGEGLTNASGIPTNYAIYVEYGTGIYTDKHEDTSKDRDWEAGWFYPAPWGKYRGKGGTKLAWTNGMPPRPFMQNTMNDLREEIEASGGRIIAEYIRGERA